MRRLSMRSDKRPGWLLDEIASAGRENLDAGHATRYDDKEGAEAEAEVEILISHGLNGSSTSEPEPVNSRSQRHHTAPESSQSTCRR
jgi:hypothetical protein